MNLVVGVLSLLIIEAGSLLVIAGLRVQGGCLLAVKSIELPNTPAFLDHTGLDHAG